MCKEHTLVFWSSPPTGTPAKYESRLRPQAGARLVSDHSQATDSFVFYELCSNSVLAIRPTCPASRIVDAGIVEDKTQPFCQVDDECTARLYEFQTRFDGLFRRQQADERAGSASTVSLEEQRAHNIELRQAWRDWASVYGNHTGCFERRNAHSMWRRLIRARAVPPVGEQPERLGVYPFVYDEPQVGFERGFQKFETRGLGSGAPRR
nr:hypothetical protein B0A51_09951 [Rachicladosporium sp. CCFEE 5018]